VARTEGSTSFEEGVGVGRLGTGIGIPFSSTSGTGFLLMRCGEFRLCLDDDVRLGVIGGALVGIVKRGRVGTVADSRALGEDTSVILPGVTLINEICCRLRRRRMKATMKAMMKIKTAAMLPPTMACLLDGGDEFPGNPGIFDPNGIWKVVVITSLPVVKVA
jgi:hypothetical protein